MRYHFSMLHFQALSVFITKLSYLMKTLQNELSSLNQLEHQQNNAMKPTDKFDMLNLLYVPEADPGVQSGQLILS